MCEMKVNHKCDNMPSVEIINTIDDFKIGQTEVNQNNCSLIQFGLKY